MQIIDERIHEAWRHEQEILDVFHDVCIAHNLKYSLIFGTLLGAVRHSGFIPWDDDIDVIMPRDDYERLLTIWDDVAPKGYLMQNKRNSPDFTQNFSKIRKDNTAFIQDECEKKKQYHTGVFIDIFPADKVAPKGIRRKLQYIANAFNLLCAREFSSQSKGLVGVIEKFTLALPHKTRLKIFRKSERYIAKWKNHAEAEWYSPNTINVCKRYFSSDLFENLSTITFNKKSYCCVSNPDKLLTKIYGNYKTLPPRRKTNVDASSYRHGF